MILDIETIAIDGAEALVEPVSAPSNYKDEAKIAAYVAEGQARQIEKAGLYPWTARIIAMGWCEDSDDAAIVRVMNSEAAERDVLGEFWGRVWDRRTNVVLPLVTFNGRAFDLPVLMVRSRLLGVRYPVLNIDRFRSPHPDLLRILTFDGVLDYRSLTWFAKRFGLPTDDAFSGREIAQLHEDGNWDAIRMHCESDVMLTRMLAERMGLVRPVRHADEMPFERAVDVLP